MRIACFADEISPVFSDQLRVMKELGIRWMDLRSCWDQSVLQLNRHQIRDIRDMAMERGIRVSCISTPIGKESIDNPLENAIAQLHRAVETAHFCESRYIRIFSYYPGEMSRSQALETAAERLSDLAEIARQEDVVLILESAKVTACGTGAEMAKLLEQVNSDHLRAVFDPAAFVAAGDRPFEDSLPKVLPYLEYVHIKDSRFGQKERFVAGEGDAQVAQVLDNLRDREDLFVSLEPHLSYAGPAGGFSGEKSFRKAHSALIRILNQQRISY